MKLLWLTNVTFGKTIHQWGELGTASELKSRGWEVDFVSTKGPNYSSILDEFGFGNFPIESVKLPGLSSIMQNRKISKMLLNDIDLDDYDVILSEWQTSIGVLLAKRKIESSGGRMPPWIFEDRSPPATPSLLGRLQWLQYGLSWKLAANSADSIEVLVPGLENFVRKKYRISKPMIHCPSGVDIDRFRPRDGGSDGVLRLVYHGTLGRGRGLNRILQLGLSLENEAIDFQITVFGSGILSPLFERESKKHTWLNWLGELPFNKVPSELAKHDIGLLPLPKKLQWDVGSPLKAMEYAACGLSVLATDVDGSIPLKDYDWFFVSPSEDPIEGWTRAINHINDNLERLSKLARKDAEENLTWNNATQSLNDELIRLAGIKSEH